MDSEDKLLVTIAFLTTLLVAIAIGTGMWGCPKYNVYEKRLKGEASLRQQEYEKQIAVEQAKALKESASLLAEAEVARAKGVAEANEIIGNSLRNGGDMYLQYLAIQAQLQMAESPNHTTVYIPSGSNGIPIVKTLEENNKE